MLFVFQLNQCSAINSVKEKMRHPKQDRVHLDPSLSLENI